MKRWMQIVPGGLLCATACFAGQLADPVEANDGWFFAGKVGSLDVKDVPPSVGRAYINFELKPGLSADLNNRAAVKALGVILRPGVTYTVSADFNLAFFNRPFLGNAFSGPASDQIAFGFFVSDGIDLSLNRNTERLKIRDAIHAVMNGSFASEPVWHSRTVPDGKSGWQRWCYSFTVAEKSPYAGRKVMFGVYTGHLSADSVQKAAAFDNLQIIYTESGIPWITVGSLIPGIH